MSVMARRLVSLLAAVAIAGLLGAAPALGDGDPASDVLLGQNVFYPYSPPVSATVRAGLDQTAAAAAKSGFPIKIALIGAPTDLGVIPELFGKPQSYADFLDKEISFNAPQPLLVVMSDGYGVQGMHGAVAAAAHKLPHPAGSTPTQLAQAAQAAIGKLAAADGHPLSGGGSSGGSSNSQVLLLIVLIVAATVVAGTLVVLRRRAPASSARR